MPERDSARCVMIIPTYNEALNLEDIVSRLRASQPAFDIIVVDDNSPDGTGDIADSLAKGDAQISVIHRAEKGGLGAAYLHGFDFALSSGYDVIGEMDADGSHQPEQLHLLLTGLDDCELVLGSRWIPGGSVVNWSKRRQWLSRGGNLYVRLALGLGVRDATGGFRLYRSRALRAIDLSKVRSGGYVFQTDLVTRFVLHGFRVKEVPIQFIERKRGDSKMSTSIAVESLMKITAWGMRKRVQDLVDLARRKGKR